MMREATVQDYEAAKARLAAVVERWANYNGNNPDKYRSELQAAREALATIEADLKRLGLVPLTETERLHAALDRTFPNAESKEIVTFEGIRYRRRFLPATYSKSSKSVRTWNATWERLADDSE
jgi:hypothetical protein